jgi:hypothetical protein
MLAAVAVLAEVRRMDVVALVVLLADTVVLMVTAAVDMVVDMMAMVVVDMVGLDITDT